MTSSDVRVLIVEDDPAWQQILGEILTDAGLAVDVVDTLEAAIDRLRAVPHRLAVVDLSLNSDTYHNQDGLRVLEAARRLDPGCVTVLLTGFATVELAVVALAEYGALTCLRKETFNRAQFRELVSQALASIPPTRSVTHSPGDTLSGNTAPVETGQTAGAAPAQGLTLVVEDDAGWRSILAELLSDACYQVRLCSSFGEALGCLRREKYVLAVVDLSLAGSAVAKTNPWGRRSAEQDLNGYRLLTSTRAAGIPTLVISGVATPDDIERAFSEHGIFAFLQKQTFDRKVFLRTVQEARLAGGASSELDCLTAREQQVLKLLAQGMTNKEMAEALFITTNTIKRHLKAIFNKLDVHTRSAAAAKAISAGIVVE